MTDIKEEVPEGAAPESWNCIDCGFNTSPGMLNRSELNAAIAKAKLEGKNWSIKQSITQHSEVYTVRDAIWKEAGMEPFGGCLCIGCLEKRIGRRLRPKDFLRNHPFEQSPRGSERLRDRRGKAKVIS
jgi:hypothetical protein